MDNLPTCSRSSGSLLPNRPHLKAAVESLIPPKGQSPEALKQQHMADSEENCSGEKQTNCEKPTQKSAATGAPNSLPTGPGAPGRWASSKPVGEGCSGEGKLRTFLSYQVGKSGLVTPRGGLMAG